MTAVVLLSLALVHGGKAGNSDLIDGYLAARTKVMERAATAADVALLGALLDEHVVYEHPAAGARIVGRRAVLEAISRHLGETRGAMSVVRHRLNAPGATAVEEELTFEARERGRWTPVRRRQLLFLEQRAGRLIRVIEYWVPETNR